MSRSLWLWTSGVTAALLLLAASLSGPDSPRPQNPPNPFSRGEPVLVFLIPEPARLLAVMRAIPAERVLFRSQSAIAFEDFRVAALDRDRAAAALEAADWIERPLEIISARSERRRAPGRRARHSVTAPDISDLLSKPSLSRADARRVLAAIDAGAL